MTNQLSDIVSQIEELQNNTKAVRDSSLTMVEKEACISKELAYQECIMLILKAKEAV